jgi:5-methylcytosine-specific restriction endonuclease McrA
MPIKPENKDLYLSRKEWKVIRAEILERAENRCEFCSIENGALGWRDTEGTFCHGEPMSCCEEDARKFIRIVLTIAHLDHDPTNNDPENLRALCQRCHNTHDAPHRQMNAAKTRRLNRDTKAGQQRLFEE